MPKQLNVDLSFNADTSKAKAAINDLNKQLQAIRATPTTLFDDVQLKNASRAAQELQQHLRAATDVDTGKLDLSKFSASLAQSGKTLSDYKKDLTALGPAGQKAFMALSQSISSAEAPLLRANKQLTEFWTTLKNTARWQISSSILHGFMGSLQSAYHYAENLNESLNNIRIVTGQSVDEMADFAKHANSAAKELSTTTTAYTDAALIFYQQGLEGDAVTERTDAVIKMANVTGDAAKDVSSYMTAIWNNFDNGSVSLEHYADVITALGAHTAASSSEIAEGLSKFASVADTIGLSYDYATSIVATLVANTRQSADTIGNSLKTVLARLQGLQLGETLEDGVDLNKYSKALDAIGVQVLDLNGQLKDADVILSETAARWDQLSKAEQTALAQTVAGTRQYAQFVAIMEGWDDVIENLGTAGNAEGTLQKQADIYAESWEAAQKRVRAAAQSIYSELIDEDFFIGVDNAIEKLLTGVNGFVKGLGGIKGIVSLVGGFISQQLAKEAPAALERIQQNIMVLSGKAHSMAQELQQQNMEELNKLPQSSTDNVWNVQLEAAKTLSQLKSELISKQGQLSQAEKEGYENQIDQVEMLYKALEGRAKELNLIEEEIRKQKEQAVSNALEQGRKTAKKNNTDYTRKDALNDRTLVEENIDLLEQYYNTWVKVTQSQKNAQKQAESWGKETNSTLEELKPKMQEYVKELVESGTVNVENKSFKALNLALKDNKISAEDLLTIFTKFANTEEAFQSIGTGANGANESIKSLNAEIEKLENELKKEGVEPKVIQALEKAFETGAISADELQDALIRLKESTQQSIDHQVHLSEAIMSVSGSLMQLNAVINAVKRFSDVFSDKDATTVEKIGAAIGLLTTTIGASVGVFKTLTLIQKGLVKASLETAAAKKAETVAVEGANAAWLSNPITAAVFIALAAAIGIASSAIEKHSKRIKESAEESRNNANAIKEETDAHKDLLKEMKESLDGYAEGTTSKEDLDTITRQLAEAYNLEGDALAQLTGKYDDYQTVLSKAYQAQEKELKKVLEKEQLAVAQTGDELLLNAREGKGHLGFEDKYNIEFSGANGLKGEENHATSILSQYLEGAKLRNGDSDYAHGMSFSIDTQDENGMTDYSNLVAFYDKLVDAKAAMDRELSQAEKTDSGVYQEVNDWIKKMSESIEEYRTHLEEVRKIQIQLGQFDGSTIKEKDINSLADYNKWIDETTNALKSMGTAEGEIEDIINDLVNNSINPQIKGFKEIADAAKEIVKLYDTALSENTIAEIFASENWDARALAIVNWGKVTEETYEAACNAAQEYIDIKDRAESAETTNEGTQAALDHIGTSKTLSKKKIEELREDLDWGNNGIIEFSEFLRMSVEEQQQYLKQLRDNAGEERIKLIDEEIEQARAKKAEWDEVVASYESGTQLQEKEDAQQTISDWDKAKQLYDNRAKGFRPEDDKEGAEVLERLGLKWADLAKMTQEQFNEKMEGAVEEAQVKIDAFDNAVSQKNYYEQEEDRLVEEKAEQAPIAAYNAESIDQLQHLLNEGIISAQDYSNALESVAEAEAKANGIDVDEFRAYKDLLAAEYPLLKNNATALNEVAIANQRLEKGVSEIAKNWKNWDAILSDSGSSMADVAAIMPKINDALSDILNLTDEDMQLLPADFAKDNWQLIDDVLHNVEGSVDELRDKASKEILMNVTGKTNFSQIDSELQGLQAKLEDFDNSHFQVGIDINDTEFISTCDAMIQKAGMTATEAQAYFKAMGYNAEIEQREVSTPVHHKIQYPVIDDKTGYATGELKDLEWDDITGTTAYAIKTITPNGSYGGGVGVNTTASKSSTAGRKDAKSGGGSKSKDKDKKTYEKEFDVYHDIQKAIDGVNDKLSSMDKLQSHLFGKQLAQSLREENGLLEEQKANYQALLEAQKAELSTVAGKLMDYGVAFDSASGQITNYAAVTLQMLEEYNAAVEALNNGSITQAAFDAIDKRFNDFKTQLGLYDSTLKQVQDTMGKIEDTYYKELENNLKAWEAEIQITLDLQEAKREWRKFLDEINTDIKLHYEDVGAELIGDAHEATSYTDTINTDIKAMRDIENEIDKLMSGGESSMFASLSEAQNELYKYRDQMQQDAESLYDLYKNAWSAYLKGVDIAKDKLDDIIDKFEFINDDLDHQASLIELLYGEKDYENLTALYNAQANNSLAQLDSLRQQVDLWKEQYDIAVKTNGENSEDAAKMYEYWTDALQDLHDQEEIYLQDIQNKYINTIDNIFDTLAKRLMNSPGGFDWVLEQWDLETDAAKGYLDEVERVYEIESLRNKYDQAIAKTNVVGQQERLRELMESQLEMLENKEDLSEYDVTLAEKRLAVAQAQLALEDAMNAKTTLRLGRDSQGNWTYQYTADLDEVDQAQQDYLDKQNEAYEYAKNSWLDMQKTIIETAQTALDKIKEINIAMMSATDEERLQLENQKQYYLQYYQDMVDKQLAASQTMEGNFQSESASSNLGFTMVNPGSYKEMTDEAKALVDELKSAAIDDAIDVYTATGENLDLILESTAAFQDSNIDTWDAAAAEIVRTWYSDPDSVRGLVIQAISDISEVLNTYFEDIDKGCKAAGENFTNVGNAIRADEKATRDLGSTTSRVIAGIRSDLDSYRQLVSAVEGAWRLMEQAIINAGNVAIEYLEKEMDLAKKLAEDLGLAAVAAGELADKLTDAADAQRDLNSAKDEDEFGGFVSGTQQTGVGGNIVRYRDEKGNVNTGKLDEKGYITINGKKYLFSDIGHAASGLEVTSNMSSPFDNIARALGEDTMVAVRKGERILSNQQTDAFDKLVYEILPAFANNGILKALSSLTGLGANMSTLGNSVSNNTNNENIYNITANFPDVTSSTEIEQALLSLNNYATQYVWER